ncbi:MAG: thermitase [Verrucomicrobiota bacterium]|jgi:subtilisin family serine protease
MPRKFTWFPLSARGALVLCCLAADPPFSALAAPAPPPRAIPFSKERILIIPKAGHEAALANQHAAERVKIRRKLSAFGNIHVLDVPNGMDPEALVEKYRRGGHVASADLDYMDWHPASVPNDPSYLNSQWHLNNTGQFAGGGFGTPGADIDAPAAWEFLNSASNVIVAIIDTGVRMTHEDLALNLWTNPGESGGGKETDGIDNDGDGFIDDVHGINILTGSGDPSDQFGHGTHVAGIIGAIGNNGVGTCGVAWKVQIMPLKFYDGFSPSDSQVMQCIEYAINHHAKVVNFSFTAGSSSPTLLLGFQDLQNADIVLCAAAGNCSPNIGIGTDNNVTPVYPASYALNNVVSVAATDNTDALWSCSNYGSTSVHLAAPGVAIFSTYNGTDTAYGILSGTSMATPMVSGAVALMRARFTNETAPQIIRRLLNAVDVLPGLAGRCTSGGRLNLRKALDTATTPLFAVTNASYNWVATNGMTPLTFLTGDGVNGPLALPFSFPFYGRSYSQIWVGANGLLGITNSGLAVAINGNLPTTNTPNAIYPFWDDLNPLAGGSVWFGIAGMAPNRKAVVSWIAVPHMTASGGPFTFQVILHESGHVAFQYDQVALGNPTYTNGKSATVGIEDPSGLFTTRYRDFTIPNVILTNNQALLFTPQAVIHPAPGLRFQPGPIEGQSHLTLSGEPAQSCAILASTNLVSWSMIYSNVLPASGLAIYAHTNLAPQRFFRAVSGPFVP